MRSFLPAGRLYVSGRGHGQYWWTAGCQKFFEGADCKAGYVIAAIEKRSGKTLFNPESKTAIEEDDALLCIAKIEKLQEMQKIL